MSLRLAAAVSLSALIVAGVVGIAKKVERSALENRVSAILQEAKIAAIPSCRKDFCQIKNLISANFLADEIKVYGLSEFFSYIRHLDARSHLLSYIASAWVPEFRGSKLWWLIYENHPKKSAKFKILIKNFRPKIDLSPLYFVLSKDATIALKSLLRGFDLSFERNLYTILRLKNSKQQSLEYDFRSSFDELADPYGFLSLFKEVSALVQIQK